MKPFLVYILLLLSFRAAGQEYNYIHYDTRDGLASSTVYWICQDKKGYIWFATDNGLSRFDGKKFTNYTTEDGLTDNEVLIITSDSKGRIWIMPFNKTLCYYYEGKIYVVKNDSTLKQTNFSSYFSFIGEGRNGEYYFCTTGGVYVYKNSGTIKLIADYKKLAAKYSVRLSDFYPGNIPYLAPDPNALYVGHSLFVIKNDSLVYLKEVKSDFSKGPYFFTIDENLEARYPKSTTLQNCNTISKINSTHYFFNTLDGSWPVDINGKVAARPFLKGKKVSYSFADNEGNIWFSTLGEGVYRLTSGAMKTFADKFEAFCIAQTNGRLYGGLNDGSLQVIKDYHYENEYPFPVQSVKTSSKRLYTLKSDSSGALYLGFDSHLAKLDKGHFLISPVRPIKSIDIIDRDNIVVCTNFFTFKLRSSDLKIIDTIWRERGTKVLYDRGFYYIGTLTGLIIIDSSKTVTRTTTDIPLLSNRIVDMCRATDGGIWIATNDNGVVLYKNSRIETAINIHNGLSSNICKSLFLKDNYLWVGTNKGVNKIDITTKKVLAKYSTADGLGSDIINAVYIDDSVTWVCSPAGLTYFKEKDISDSSICILDLHSVYVSGKKIDSTGDLKLSYKDNNISFDYAAISFKSAGEIIYRYKLSGLDDDWKETKLTTLAYPSLPPGDYKLQLFAINKFGKHSDTATIQFTIAAPFWKTAWFWIAISALAIAIAWYLLSRRYKYLQKRMKEKNDLTKKITELEQASLRAQMNPHFIFNCLNSIQHYILINDIEHTNKYITQFASLIRQTLDNSASINISIADEMKYLGSYLELEKMRFPSQFQYTISLPPEIQADYTFIPSMILQPFVENAVRHGIRHKKDGIGQIQINIRKTDDSMLFIIEDNGVGREEAAKYKTKQHIEYQSKGITLAQDRLEILNSFSLKKITTLITDLKNESGVATGTKIVISFPLSIIEKLN